MILLTHIVIALASVIYASYTLYVPSKAKLDVSYVLILLTLLSGSYLTVTTPSHMLQACASGLVYSGAVLVMTMFAKRKLAQINIDKD
ncbi:MAG: hypothetical protein Q7T74_04300 [Candidatus Saccharibacteria bacterium]|nr:hypothetical protein [Candidatus Saccharibacteria bacterium]